MVVDRILVGHRVAKEPFHGLLGLGLCSRHNFGEYRAGFRDPSNECVVWVNRSTPDREAMTFIQVRQRPRGGGDVDVAYCEVRYLGAHEDLPSIAALGGRYNQRKHST
jgi:hypothetical protein